MVPATGSIYLGGFRVDRHLIIQNTHSNLLSSWSHILLLNFHRSMQIVLFLMPGYPFTSCDHLPTLLVAEPLVLTKLLLDAITAPLIHHTIIVRT